MYSTVKSILHFSCFDARSCLNEFKNHYFPKIIQPETKVSDHGSQFASPSARKALAELDIRTRDSPIRHPESNPTERVVRELGKYFKIYCHENHKKMPELVPYIEDWLNSASEAIELLDGNRRPDDFSKLLKKAPDQLPVEDSLAEKLLRAHARRQMETQSK
jgi:transposase InsO family protein